jgi:hypothetical protein
MNGKDKLKILLLISTIILMTIYLVDFWHLGGFKNDLAFCLLKIMIISAMISISKFSSILFLVILLIYQIVMFYYIEGHKNSIGYNLFIMNFIMFSIILLIRSFHIDKTVFNIHLISELSIEDLIQLFNKMNLGNKEDYNKPEYPKFEEINFNKIQLIHK